MINVSSDDSFGLALERNLNVSNGFDAAVDGGMEMTHRIMRVVTSTSNNSFSSNPEMVQERWGIHTYVANNTVEHTTQCGIIIFCPHPSLMKHMRTNDRTLR